MFDTDSVGYDYTVICNDKIKGMPMAEVAEMEQITGEEEVKEMKVPEGLKSLRIKRGLEPMTAS